MLSLVAGSRPTSVVLARVTMVNGHEIRKDHGYGFDAWAELIKLEAAMKLGETSDGSSR